MKVEAFIPAVLLLCFGVMLCLKSSCALQIGNNNELKNYISWEDLRVVEDGRIERSFSIKENSNWVTTNANANANATNVRRVIVVDKNGGGDSVTVQGAVDMVPDSNSQRVKIFILPGIYREKVIVPKSKPYISFIGNESYAGDTVISWSDKASDLGCDGKELGTYRTASVSIESDFFCATAITFENTVVAEAGEQGRQAVALRIIGDKAVFYRVRVLGSQDTLFDDNGSHYFYQCYIQGNVDFIFGNAKSLYQDCDIHSTAKRYGAIAAHHRDSETEDTGFSFVNCDISGTGQIYLGRAWGNYSRTVYSNCFIADIITPVGWSDWKHPERQRKVMFGEYNCRGRGAERGGRVPWSKTLTRDEVKPFLGREFIYGDQWLRL
ncbi:Pectinesterase QRT1 [Arabidopsis thaliana]|jgi:pectinesterase|uniref:Pectinesterase QRT1 n=5 Tax=Arabidopsis TaxID=3701 RepID=PME62_ARATH|nr:Pectin lyase-like superfamily protein [Arabidopsis thaliana]Q9FM79.1 RecName: Full=Pectinesterase QRT1; Short=PE QRT1; AltName: Full=Pectin methylesterase 62; Short=AtPME62; AltName: Full=Pectin methylesterase QRT1; AltName: Full=Protein QUARTET 1; Short=AtQRT1; Flags: Precursor [Arabidopsis thaliana]KAG7606198.1 Pectin lyase fold/virulence factor [Arabidopsis thaliana x Arabidopsis arenosa]ABI97858.1 quartet1 [Arabidopsis thaliana]AED96653.1 Pectin lyase-like superfamily protein [Arabidopsi|eukprot:NP_200370.1 Pectin lyase-like superfamily protein [Arabidopsis thaliana]